MSFNVIEASKQLNQLILDSEEYQKYCLYKKELSQMPELRQRTFEFRKKNFELQLEGNTEDKEAAVRLAAEYIDVLANPMAASYLNAELSFCKLLQGVTKNVYRDIEMELEFL